jgi:DNA adenine methylase
MRGPLSYIGGKNRLAKRIVEMFPEHLTYVEAFAGGAQVFFHKQPSTVEVLNDLDGEIVNFYRVCKEHYEELLRYFKYMIVSRCAVCSFGTKLSRWNRFDLSYEIECRAGHDCRCQHDSSLRTSVRG